MKKGTFKLAYEKDEIQEPIQKGIKIVNKSNLPAFATNNFEK